MALQKSSILAQAITNCRLYAYCASVWTQQLHMAAVFMISPPNILLIWQNETFFHLCPLFELCVPPCPQFLCRWHICIWLFAEISPWCPCHVWRPPAISSVRCVKWAMTSSSLSFKLTPSFTALLVSLSCTAVRLYDAGG